MALERSPERPPRAMDLVQRNFDALDASLPPEFKERFPIRTRQEIDAEFPNKWLAILATRVDELVSVCEGRLIATARGRRALEDLVAPLLADLPGHSPFRYFNYQPSAVGRRNRRPVRGDREPVTT